MAGSSIKATTPASVTEAVLRLREKIGVNTEPVFVPVQPAPHSALEECYRNVFTQVQERGGARQTGWCIWEHPGLFVEGVFHAIWLSPEGNLVDITPHRDGEQRILFIPDPTRSYNGQPIDNIRLPLVQNPRVERLMRMNEEMLELRKKYLLPDGRAAVPAIEVIQVVVKHTSRNDQCPCRSSRKFKHCCGQLNDHDRATHWVNLARSGKLSQG
jgi:hypothetical protein